MAVGLSLRNARSVGPARTLLAAMPKSAAIAGDAHIRIRFFISLLTSACSRAVESPPRIRTSGIAVGRPKSTERAPGKSRKNVPGKPREGKAPNPKHEAFYTVCFHGMTESWDDRIMVDRII